MQEPATLPNDRWTYISGLSDATIANLRADFVKGQPGAVPTCDSCPRKFICVLTYDQYNTDGDCLYDK